jgi:hypothetical protein
MQPGHQQPLLPEPFIHRGAVVKWAGTVQIERPEGFPRPDAMCNVFSARAIEFGGRRAVCTKLPYSLVRQLFQSDDDGSIYVAADLRGEHLQLHERCDFKEWAYNSGRFN